ncbi:PAS domain-containing protein [Xanthocytophaga flava]|uniref:PAS domain-containing protein n=1 Tax=Xanthocytophaga flava TaxID=3048013 RepID=UPI0028D5A36B|nr:PAS domain-containing protein [Xanthocytophaga flavus]MDJ1469254.1 PAS domain-containing protein [Xanthocytophaga flavus]
MSKNLFEQRLSEWEDWSDVAFQLGGIGRWELDLSQYTVYWDDRCRELYGFPSEEAPAYNDLLEYIYPEDRVKVEQAVNQSLTFSDYSPYNIRFRTIGVQDKKIRWIHCKGKTYFNPEGNPYRFVGTAQDITELIESQTQVATSERLAGLALEGANAGWFTIRLADNYMEYSKALVKIMTGTEQPANRNLLIEHLHPDDTSLRDKAYQEVTESEKLRYEARFIWDDGSIHWVRVIGAYQYDSKNTPFFFAGIVQDITSEVLARRELQVSEERFRSIVEQAPMGLGLLKGSDMIIEVGNQRMFDLWGKDNSIIGMKLMAALPELEGQGFWELLQNVYHTGEPFLGKGTLAKLQRKGKLEDAYFDFAYSPLRTATDSVSGIMVLANEVTAQVLAQQGLKASEAKFRSLIEEAPFATALYRTEELLIDIANPVMIELWGKDQQVIGLPLAEALPELQSQPFLEILAEVYKTGNAYHATQTRVDLVRNGKLGSYYFNFTYKPLRDEKGEIYAILNMAVEVTSEVLYQIKLEESELFARSIIYNSPVAKLVLTGEDMNVQTVNENMMQMLGKDDSIIGKPFREALPELRSTQLMDRLSSVYTSGKTYYQSEEKLELIRFGQPYIGYYNYIYKSLANTKGEIYGVIVTATEVTEQVLARKKVEEAEAMMRGAIELTNLATWTYDPVTNRATYSDRLREWFGILPGEENLDDIYPVLSQEDQERISAAMIWALNPESEGVYNEEYEIKNRTNGQKYIIHAQARTLFDKQGKPVKMVGTAQDVTRQRQLQVELERLVQLRTEELAATNEELAATNEELATTNEELIETNTLLTHSNQQLEQFAFVASHDLQEPLRKIQSFSDLLKTKYSDKVGDALPFLERIQVAAKRMSILIKDLLSFSRLSFDQQTTTVISLNDVLQTVQTELELRISETSAQIASDSLPDITGDRSQLEQLFFNLISNSLKFIKPAIQPQIRIQYQLVSYEQLPSGIKPAHKAKNYHTISLADNGIGFEEEYSERIFQMFQRLHAKTEFEGTGIGLAICAKVVINHGGAITASGKPGQGAVFTIYLPEV